MVEVAYTNERSTSLVEPPPSEFALLEPPQAVRARVEVTAIATTALRRRDGAALMRDRMGPSLCGRVGRRPAPPRDGGPWCGWNGQEWRGPTGGERAAGAARAPRPRPRGAWEAPARGSTAPGGEGGQVTRKPEKT